jgi:hypothetical protein
MKKIIILLVLLFTTSSFSQNVNKDNSFSNFKFGFLGGLNFSNPSGSALFVESGTNLSPSLNVIFSFGYSLIYKHEGYEVKTYQYSVYFRQYDSYSFIFDRIKYSIIPISLGLEYTFIHNKFSPYSILEVGYNIYNHEEEISNIKVGYAGSASTIYGLPTDYQNQFSITKNSSYRIALGLGTYYNISSSFSLDLRFVYQINSSMVNSGQILLGIKI